MPRYRSPNLERLLRASSRATLLRLCDLYRLDLPPGFAKKAALIDRLAQTPQVDAKEVVLEVLRKPELVAACAALGVQPVGTRDQLADRLFRVLKWRPFDEARAFVQSLALTKNKEWRLYSKGALEATHGLRPPDIPGAPPQVYRHAGWESWGDFLGTGTVATTRRVFLPFEEAREFVHALELRGTSDWLAWLGGDRPDLPPRPDSIPTNPSKVYRGAGWVSLGDWFGTGTVATQQRVYWPYPQSRRFVQRLGFQNLGEFHAWARGERPDLPPFPTEIPANPSRLLGWQGWGDFLGTGNVAPSEQITVDYAEARRLSRAHGFETQRAWRAWRLGEREDLPPCPAGIPYAPEVTYLGKGWVDWVDFLGASYVPRRRPFRSFAKARRLVQRLGIESGDAYKAWCRGEHPDLPQAPHDLPTNPWRTYAEQWQGWYHFLGTQPKTQGSPRRPRGHVARRGRATPESGWSGFRPFDEARAFVRALGLRNEGEWRAWLRGELGDKPPRPSDIPTSPRTTYHDEFQGLSDWLGTGNKPNRYASYLPWPEARALARTLGLRSSSEYRAWHPAELARRGTNLIELPSRPAKHYRREWTGWKDFLGASPSRRRRAWRPFTEARAFARSLKLESHRGWRRYLRGELVAQLGERPADIPATPENVYPEWTSWGDFLGTGNLGPTDYRYRPFAEARAYVQSLGLKNQAEWAAWCKGKLPDRPPRPPDVPTNPHHQYPEQWRSLGDWLGTGAVAPSLRNFPAFPEARTLARAHAFPNQRAYKAWVRGEAPDLEPPVCDLPLNPHATYAGKGWQGWNDFLGKPLPGPKQRTFLPFAEARAFVRALGLSNSAQYNAWSRGDRPDLPPRPAEIPAVPHRTYAEQWRGMHDWLGCGFLDFAEARRFARSLGLTSRRDWLRWRRGELAGLPPRPRNVPANPNTYYRDRGWLGWRNFLRVPASQ